jgi:hypothetical protein
MKEHTVVAITGSRRGDGAPTKNPMRAAAASARVKKMESSECVALLQCFGVGRMSSSCGRRGKQKGVRSDCFVEADKEK